MTAIHVTQRPGLFSITDYPNTTAGDDATGLRAAFNACVAAGGGVVQLENKRGGYNVKSVAPDGDSLSVIFNPPNSGVNVEIRGRGPNATYINLTSPAAVFIGHQPNVTQPTVWPISCYDFTLDCSLIKASSFSGVLYWYHVTATALNGYSTTGITHVERVNIQRLGHDTTFPRLCLNWSINRAGLANAQALPTCTLQGLRVLDCDWGHGPGGAGSQPGGRGGGQSGVNIGAFVNSSDGAKTASGHWNVDAIYGHYNNPANVIIDDIVVEGLKWTGGRSPVQNASGPGAPIQTGGDGITNNVTIRDCYLEQSEDIGIELDGVRRCLVENTTIYNVDGNAIFLMPYAYSSGIHDPETADLVVRDCEVIYPAVDHYGTTITTGFTGTPYSTGSRFGGIFDGRVIWDNCHLKYEAPWDAGGGMFRVSPARETIMRDCRVTVEDTASRAAATLNAIQIISGSGRQTCRIENFRYDSFRSVDTVTAVDQVLVLGAAADLNLQVDGVRVVTQGASTNSGKRQLRLVLLNASTTEFEETWSTDTIRGNSVFEAGVYTDYTYDGTNHWYTATNNLTTEKRAMSVTTAQSTESEGAWARTKDSGYWCQFAPGASQTGYKAGTFAKHWDSSTYLEGYVYDDGTNTYLCLDKVIAGSRTSLLPAAGGTATGANNGGNMVTDTITSPPTGVSTVGLILGHRLASTHYESLIVKGNTVTAEHWVSAKPGTLAVTGPTGTGDAYATVTLTGADINSVGANMIGESGWSQIPISATAYVKNMKHRRLAVLRGHLNDMVIEDVGRATSAMTAIQYQPGTVLDRLRIDGSLDITNCDWTQFAGTSGTPVDYDYLANTTGVTQYVVRRGNKVVTPLADTAVTFVSGTAWQNTIGCAGTLTVQGGTVSKIEVSKDGTNYRDTGVTAGSFRVMANWYVKLTHTGAPTSYFVAED